METEERRSGRCRVSTGGLPRRRYSGGCKRPRYRAGDPQQVSAIPVDVPSLPLRSPGRQAGTGADRRRQYANDCSWRRNQQTDAHVVAHTVVTLAPPEIALELAALAELSAPSAK